MHRRICRFMIALVVLFLTGAAPSNSEVVWNVETDQKLIALTFDDGPNPVYTPQILDLLNQYGAKGTFFSLLANACRCTCHCHPRGKRGT